MNLPTRLALLFLLFLALVTTSVTVTAWMVNDQHQDARVINLAGRQRMLVQQMTSQALQIGSGDDRQDHQQALSEAQAVFEQTLEALLNGGETYYLPGQMVSVPAATSREIQDGLAELQIAWQTFRTHLAALQMDAPGSPGFESALRSIQALSPQLTGQADRIVRLYEADSEHKVARLRRVQAGFFVCAGGLLVFGVVMTRRHIIAPLRALQRAAGKIGAGDLSSPIKGQGPPELAALAASLDAMRVQLKTLTTGLESRVAQRTRELTALHEVLREVSSRLEIEHVLQSVTSKARDLLDSEVAFLCLIDEAGELLALTAYKGPQDAVCGARTLARHSVAGQVLGRRQAMICDADGCQNIAPQYRASHLVAPLRIGERIIGALCVGSARPFAYSQEQVSLLTELANSTAIALENARLYEQAERVATLEERQRIAADMHDGLAQTLSYVKLKADRLAPLIEQGEAGPAAAELALIGQAIDRANDELRHSIASLRSAPVADRPLQVQLAELVASLSQPSDDFSVEVAMPEGDSVVLDSAETVQIVRVVQEALHNTRRHASAAHVTIRLDRQERDYRLIVQDDGCGFDMAGAAGQGHFGLSIMQARAARIGGTLSLRSAPGQGTQVILTWPVRRAVSPD